MRGRPRTRVAATALMLAALVAAALAIGGCGGSASGESSSTLTVLAASSLTAALGEYGKEFPGADVRSSFAGSDQLAAQIRQGAPADVFASADAGYPQRLYREGLVEKPRVFAHNRLVAILPSEGRARSLSELAQPGMKIAIGDPSVPVGEYTHEVLSRLPTAEKQGILANVASEEPEATAVVAKVAAGAADAGFVYATDAKAARGEVRTAALPERLQPQVAYAAAVVRHASDPVAAKRYLSGLVSGAGAAALRKAGFLPR